MPDKDEQPTHDGQGQPIVYHDGRGNLFHSDGAGGKVQVHVPDGFVIRDGVIVPDPNPKKGDPVPPQQIPVSPSGTVVMPSDEAQPSSKAAKE